MISIRAYRAVDEPETCKEYMNGHIQVLKDYGIESITSNNNVWLTNPNMYCFIATDTNNVMVGGIRIQVADGVFPLPVEDAIGKMDTKIHKTVHGYALNGGVGELCGLWNSSSVKGNGISFLLVRSAISAINQMGFQTLTGICAGYSLKMFQNVGFVIDNSLGKNGDFIYPNENYLAHVVGILNGLTLETANSYDKERMLTLRENPKQIRTESGAKKDFQVSYNLIITNKTKIVLPKDYVNFGHINTNQSIH